MRVLTVIAARNCATSIANVLRQLHKAGISDCIAVVNGCTDQTMQIVRETEEDLDLTTHMLLFEEPLGHDVPRAAGAIAALRMRQAWDGIVFVDGDWMGSFGQNLHDFLDSAVSRSLDVAWPKADVPTLSYMVPQAPDSDEHTAGTLQIDERPLHLDIWRQTLLRVMPSLQDVSPSRLPLWVSRRVFDRVSPRLLYHPGRWLAACVTEVVSGQHTTLDVMTGLRVGCIEMDIRWLGNPTGSQPHQTALRETMVGDALEGTALLQAKHPTRTWRGKTWMGYHPRRNLSALDEFASSISSGGGDSKL